MLPSPFPTPPSTPRRRSLLGPRLALAGLGLFALGLMTPFACIPHPEGDFEDYQERIQTFPKPVVEAAVFESAPPPTKAVEGLYYGACLSELGFGQPTKVFNFYTITKFTPDPSGAKLTLSIQPLKVEAQAPPAKVEKAGIVGGEIPAPPAAVDAEGRFTLELGTVNVPGTANPISGSDVQIDNAKLIGRFAEAKFCSRLGGQVIKPIAAARTLDIELNVCQFVPIKDGDPTPTFTSADFQAASCPL